MCTLPLRPPPRRDRRAAATGVHGRALLAGTFSTRTWCTLSRSSGSTSWLATLGNGCTMTGTTACTTSSSHPCPSSPWACWTRMSARRVPPGCQMTLCVPQHGPCITVNLASLPPPCSSLKPMLQPVYGWRHCNLVKAGLQVRSDLMTELNVGPVAHRRACG